MIRVDLSVHKQSPGQGVGRVMRKLYPLSSLCICICVFVLGCSRNAFVFCIYTVEDYGIEVDCVKRNPWTYFKFAFLLQFKIFNCTGIFILQHTLHSLSMLYFGLLYLRVSVFSFFLIFLFSKFYHNIFLTLPNSYLIQPRISDV